MERKEIVEAFVEALRETLATMAMLELEVESIEEANHGAIQADLAATIGLSGTGRGMLLITLASELAPQIAAAMLGMDASEIGDEEAGDTIAELANMTAGGAKRAFANTPFAFNLALPTRIVGAKPAVVPPHGVLGSLVHGRVGGASIQLGVWLEAGSEG